jgi:hypothetical protein
MKIKLLILLFGFLSACSVTPVSKEAQESTTSTLALTFCEKTEVEYIELTNSLFDSSFELNKFIDEISPNPIDQDREKFFNDIEKNWEYQGEYKLYLETRLNVYKAIYALYNNNSECNISGDQEISLEQIETAEKDLKEFNDRYDN